MFIDFRQGMQKYAYEIRLGDLEKSFIHHKLT